MLFFTFSVTSGNVEETGDKNFHLKFKKKYINPDNFMNYFTKTGPNQHQENWLLYVSIKMYDLLIHPLTIDGHRTQIFLTQK